MVLSASISKGEDVPRAGAGFAGLPGWAEDAHEQAFAVFRASCERVVAYLPGVAGPRRPDGALEPYWDRAAIEDGALAGRGLELIYLAAPFDLFLAQIQGSFRVRLREGGSLRLGYAARNGYPFSPISRVLVARG